MIPAHPASSLRIFIVEDHDAILKLLSRYLVAHGHIVVATVDIHSARKEYRQGEWDLMICDKHLPDGDGWELLCETASEHLPPYAVAMSGAATESDVEMAIAVGCHHLAKPFGVEQIDAILEDATLHRLQQSRLSEAQPQN